MSFENEGETLVGTLYLPAEHDGEERLPTVVVTGAWTSVEEQMPREYALEMAERGFAALTFDFRGWGKSGNLADDIEWHIPGQHPLAGTKSGKDEVLAFFEQLGKGAFQAELLALIDEELQRRAPRRRLERAREVVRAQRRLGGDRRKGCSGTAMAHGRESVRHLGPA